MAKTVKQILEIKGADVETIGPTATALEAAHHMNDRHIGSLVVIDGDQVVGIITERDILRRLVADERDPRATKVFELMTSPVAFCVPDTALEECRHVMTTRRIRHLPVVVEGRLHGMITSGDILAQEINDHKDTIQYLNEYLYQPPAPHG